jgi:Ala-tRNA(Pro) deacylase
MGIAITLRAFLESHDLPYEVVPHEHAETSQHTASAVRQPGDKVVKSVLLKDEEGYLLAVLPASYRVHLGDLHRMLRRRVGLATEREAAALFNDCEIGAIPPTGLLYDVDTVVDDALLEQPDVYFEAGDHEQLIHMTRTDFRRLLGDSAHSRFSRHL